LPGVWGCSPKNPFFAFYGAAARAISCSPKAGVKGAAAPLRGAGHPAHPLPFGRAGGDKTGAVNGPALPARAVHSREDPAGLWVCRGRPPLAGARGVLAPPFSPPRLRQGNDFATALRCLQGCCKVRNKRVARGSRPLPEREGSSLPPLSPPPQAANKDVATALRCLRQRRRKRQG
jgi:hypothetical protein